MKQKFRKFTYVKVANTIPDPMGHFQAGFIGIVDGTYSQIYGGSDTTSYAIYQLDSTQSTIINRISWYEEDQLTEWAYQDREHAEDLIEEYNLKRK